MAFHLDTRNTKYLHNYEAALRHHNSIIPIRGTNTRPVAERRKKHFDIRKDTTDLTNGENKNIIVRLYQTDIVTYYPPDHPTHPNQIKINIPRRWNSMSTRAAVRAVTGVDITNADRKAWVKDQDGKHYLVPEKGVWLQVEDSQQGHKVLNPTYPTVHRLNRKQMNAKRAQMKPFIQHMVGLAKLVGQDAAAWQIELEYPARGDAYMVEAAEGSDLEAWGKVAKWLMWSTRGYRYAADGSGYRTHFCHKRAVKKLENYIIKTCPAEVLIKETITDGRIVRDRYK